MKKIMIVEDIPQQGFFVRLMKKLFEFKEVYVKGGVSLKRVIKDKTPDFLFLNIKKPVNGTNYDVMSEVSLIDEYCRLRVTYIKISFKPLLYLSPIDAFNFVKKNFRYSILKKKEALIKE